jgi:hypothetical protein
MTAGDGDLESRIRRLEDRQELWDLAARYCQVVDDRDIDGIVSVFSSDPTVKHADGSVGGRGPEGVRAYYEGRLKGVGVCFHYPHTQLVEFDGDDRASADVNSHAEMAVDGQMIVGALRYRDEYVREAGAWKIAQRTMRFFYLMPAIELPERLLGPDRKRWPEVGPAELPESVPTYQAFRARVG